MVPDHGTKYMYEENAASQHRRMHKDRWTGPIPILPNSAIVELEIITSTGPPLLTDPQITEILL